MVWVLVLRLLAIVGGAFLLRADAAAYFRGTNADHGHT
jgi:hypothetical protein